MKVTSVPPQAPSPLLSTGIFVYVGSFETPAKAKSIARSLQGLVDFPIAVVKNTGSKPFATSLGPLPSMAQANQLLDQLVNTGHSIVRIIIQR
jgi:hypothetical protein